MEGFNIWAVLAAAASAFLLGGLWYSPLLFLKPWLKATGQGDHSNSDAKMVSGPTRAGEAAAGKGQGGKHPARVFGISFVFAFLAACAFAYFIGPRPPLDFALGRGALVGFGFVAASFGINYQFADRGFVLWAIDGGYHLAQFTLYGLILGLWH